MPTSGCSQTQAPKEQEQQQLPCPRCESNNTKFCYYNNYNSAQPRYFCKACRRYWTQGGALRNIPVGGGTRKSSNKRTRTAPAQLQCNASYGNSNTTPLGLPPHGSFTSLLNSQVLCPEFVGLGFFDNMGLVGIEGGGGGLCWPGLINGLGNANSNWQAENECSTWQPGLTIPSVSTECLK